MLTPSNPQTSCVGPLTAAEKRENASAATALVADHNVYVAPASTVDIPSSRTR